jgi:PAS domain S-box-containing protein
MTDDLETLGTVFDSLATGVVVCDREGTLRYFNREAEKILGTGLQGIAPRAWASAYGCFLPDQHTPYPADQLPLARAIRGEDVPDDLVFLRNQWRPAGVWVSVSSRPFHNVEGAIRGAAAVFRDVTQAMSILTGGSVLPAVAQGEYGEFLERLDRLRGHFDRFARVVEQTEDSVLITNRSGIIEYVNPAFERTTGYRADEAIGQTPRILKSGKHDDRLYVDMWDRLLRGRSFRGTLINRRKDGALYWAEQTITPIRDSSGEITHFVSLLKDVTEERARQEQEFHLSMAARIQRRFYDLDDAGNDLDLAANVYPAATIGGDHVDVLRRPDGEAWVVVGDVSGHGFGSALLMAETRAYVRAFAVSEPDLGRLLSQVNGALAADLDDSSFVTLLLVAIDPYKLTYRYASAGHVTGFLIRRSGEVVRTLESTDPPLGIFPDRQFSSGASGVLAPGDIFVLLTDGVTEVKEDGGAWVIDFVRAHEELSAKGLVEGICTAAREQYDGRQQTDDCTAMVCRVNR